MKTYKSAINRLELKRVKTDFPKAKITCSNDANKYAHQFYFDDIDIYESFFIILLNNANNTTGYVKISSGGITGVLVDVRLVAKYAIDGLATAVILVHNHPSGTIRPSVSDNSLTKKIKEGLKLFDINVLDHVIITNETSKYYSYADEGTL